MVQTLMTQMGAVPPAAMQVDAKQFLIKILRMRGKLIAEKKGRWNDGSVIHDYTTIKRWFEFYKPNPTQCAAYIRMNCDMISNIMPGKACTAHESLNKDFFQITTA